MQAGVFRYGKPELPAEPRLAIVVVAPAPVFTTEASTGKYPFAASIEENGASTPSPIWLFAGVKLPVCFADQKFVSLTGAV